MSTKDYENQVDKLFSEVQFDPHDDTGYEPIYEPETNGVEEAKKRRRRKKNPDAVGTDDDAPTPPAPPKEDPPGILTIDEDKLTALEAVPTLFVEPEEKAYSRDEADLIVPAGGFVQDYVNTARGMEIPSLFMIWGALWTVSTALAREAWLEWYPKPLWPNLYVLFVAPPGLCHKSTAMDIGKNALEKMLEHLPDSISQFRKGTNYVTGKCTSDALLMSLAPARRAFVDMEESRVQQVERGSHVALAISELAMFLGKQQYNVNLVTTLTDLFDCKDSDAEVTRARGVEPLKNVYVTFCGATTPDSLKTSIPEEALGGGFLSRLLIAYQDMPTKICSRPKALKGYPTPDTLPPKLAWIAHHAKGEYYLTDEADKYYDSWYHQWKQGMFASLAAESASDFRRDTLLLRLALLIRAQEYRHGRDITVENLETAKKLLDFTLRTARPATEDLGMNEYTRFLNIIRRTIGKRGAVQRVELQRMMSARGCRVTDFNVLIQQLVLEDAISIELDGKSLSCSANSGKEIYKLTEYGLERAKKEGVKWAD
jgi:hypothetical protein